MQPRDTIHTQNQCIFQVPAFISNARPFIQYIKSYLSKKILFSKISIFFFQNFVPFCLILFYFFKKKKFFSENFLLFIVTVHRYCSPKLQYNFSYCNTLPAHCNTPPGHNTMSVLQYNPQPLKPSLAIQFSATTHTILQYTLVSCNTNFQPNYTPKLQYNPCIAI